MIRRIMVSSSYLMLTTVVTSGLGYGYWVVAARLFDAYVVGYLAAVVSAMMLVTTVGNMGLGLGVAYLLPEAGRRWSSLVNGVLLTVAVVAALLSAVLIFGAALLQMELGRIAASVPYLAAFVATSALWTLAFVLDQVLTIEQVAGLVLVRNTISSLLRLAALPLITWLGLGDAQDDLALIAAWGLSALLSSAVVAIRFARHNPGVRRLSWAVSPRGVREVIPLSATNHLLTAVIVAPSLVLPIAVTQLLSVEENAYFYTTWMVATILFTVPYASSTALFAHTAADETLGRASINRVIALTMAVVVPLALAVILTRDVVLSFFGPAYVAHGSGLLVGLACASIPLSLFQLYIGIQRVRKSFANALVVATIGSVLSIAATLMVGATYGLTGMGVALGGAYLITGLVCAFEFWVQPRLPRAGQLAD
jgi:O-antigen/teichoic acid export membrane protein